MTGEAKQLRAVVTGAGVVSAAGENPDLLAAAAREGNPLAAEITAFDPSGGNPSGGEPTRACEIHEFDLARHIPSVKSYIDRTSALALAATKLALADAGLLAEAGSDAGRAEHDANDVGLAYGTQWGCLDSMELFCAKLRAGSPRFAPPLPFTHSYANSPASLLAIEFRLRGHHAVYSTGRTSGARAVLGGADAVAAGRAEVIACVASDSFSRAAFSHYAAKGLLLPDSVSTATEDGGARFFLGEGAACLLIDSETAARARGAQAKARVLGSGAASAKNPLIALEDALREALLRAEVIPAAVTAAFGTAASRAGVEVETRAVASSLGVSTERAREMLVPVGAVLGETMGASGVLAAVAACAGDIDGAALVLSAEAERNNPSAVALVLGPAG